MIKLDDNVLPGFFCLFIMCARCRFGVVNRNDSIVEIANI